MKRLTTTPFGQREVTAGLLATEALAQQPAPVPDFNKWELFRNLCVARHQYGVTDRDLTVLNALLSFHKGDTLGNEQNLIVFPSNRALSERAHGMAESTLRRHLAALTRAGLILRHDSPNGKRYVKRDLDGEITRAFGFDLRPLLVQSEEIGQYADATRVEAIRYKNIREEAVLCVRDALKLISFAEEDGYSGDWEGLRSAIATLQRYLRRKLRTEEVQALHEEASRTLKDIRDMFECKANSENVGGKDSYNERHIQNSNKDSPDFEPCLEKSREEMLDTEQPNNVTRKNERLPLAVVLKACPEISLYASDPIYHWEDLHRAAGFVRGMMGISLDAWQSAQKEMGGGTAAIVVACILQRVDMINSPGGYLRALTRKAEEGAFSPGPMVMALLNFSTKDAA